MTITLNGTSGIVNDATDLNYTGTLTGGTGVVNLGSGQVYKDASGNVGIGTSSPSDSQSFSRALDMRGTTGSAYYSATSDNTTRGYFATFTGGAYVGSETNHPLVFRTNNTERARIDSSGNLLVGTTSGSSKINAKGVASNNAFFFEHTTTGDGVGVLNQSNSAFTSAIFATNSATAANTTWKHLQCYSSNFTVINMQILGNGNLQNANNSYGAISDIKLKENIVDATPKLDKLQQVRVVNYNLKGDYEQHKQIGVIAQELELIFPGLVDETPDRDQEGNDLGTTTKSVKYSVFVPMLIKAIQEQQTIITALTARITALEGAAA